MGKKLYHWTSAALMKDILANQRLELEGEHFVNNKRLYSSSQIKDLNEKYSACGRFVWFTERLNRPVDSDQKNEMAITVDSDEINAQKWHFVKKKNKDNTAFMKLAKKSDDTAKMLGDDPYQWWLVKEAIDLDRFKFTVSVSAALKEELAKKNEKG